MTHIFGRYAVATSTFENCFHKVCILEYRNYQFTVDSHIDVAVEELLDNIVHDIVQKIVPWVGEHHVNKSRDNLERLKLCLQKVANDLNIAVFLRGARTCELRDHISQRHTGQCRGDAFGIAFIVFLIVFRRQERWRSILTGDFRLISTGRLIWRPFSTRLSVRVALIIIVFALQTASERMKTFQTTQQ